MWETWNLPKERYKKGLVTGRKGKAEGSWRTFWSEVLFSYGLGLDRTGAEFP